MEKDRSHAFLFRPITVLCLVISVLGISPCAAHVSKADYSTLTIAVGPSRELETGWPDGSVPAFGSVVVTVSAADMDTITQTATPYDKNITMKIPAGNDRLVAVRAMPASAGTAPYFAKAYVGSASVDIGAGETKTVPLKLDMSETKIILPDHSGYIYTIRSADSLSSGLDPESYSPAYLGESSDFEFDGYGRLFYTDPEMGLLRISSPTDTGVGIDGSLAYEGLAYVNAQARLYYANYSALGYIDVAAELVGSIDIIDDDVAGLNSAIAADGSAVYADGYLQSEEPAICKIILSEATITDIPFVTYATIGLTEDFNLNVEDMIVKDGVLYIAARYVILGYSSSETHSCGKIIAVSTATLTKLWECGWNGDQIPQDENSSQLYGPIRFVGIAPKKLYVADEGFSWNGISGTPVVNVDRVVEIDLDTQAISGSGLLNQIAFFSDYSGEVWNC